MKLFRIRFEVHIDAHDLQDAKRRARVLHLLLGQRYWVQAVFPEQVEECPVIQPSGDG